MAGCTIRRKLKCQMGRIIRLIVVLDMTARTRVGRVIVIPVVAAGALVGDDRVTSV